ncbi:hypothetical protein LZ32DRAFT_315620 [Colletotrichum eremochloae]|nr:hypothetical protein LZ32DRAFT_315620 [Colletotrichum eremochloae]
MPSLCPCHATQPAGLSHRMTLERQPHHNVLAACLLIRITLAYLLPSRCSAGATQVPLVGGQTGRQSSDTYLPREGKDTEQL